LLTARDGTVGGALTETVGMVSLSTVTPTRRRSCGVISCCSAAVRGIFQETEPRKTADNTVKHREGGVGSVVASHRDDGESSVAITMLFANWKQLGENPTKSLPIRVPSRHDVEQEAHLSQIDCKTHYIS